MTNQAYLSGDKVAFERLGDFIIKNHQYMNEPFNYITSESPASPVHDPKYNKPKQTPADLFSSISQQLYTNHKEIIDNTLEKLMEKGVHFNEERMKPKMKEAYKQIQQKLETEKQVSAKKEEANKKPELGAIRCC